MLTRILDDEVLVHSLQALNEASLRHLTVQSILLAVTSTGRDPEHYAGELNAILNGAPVVNRDELRAQADDLEEQVDAYNERFPSGWPADAEAARHDLMFKGARLLAAICEGSDLNRPTVESTAWCLYEVSFVVDTQAFDKQVKALAHHLATTAS